MGLAFYLANNRSSINLETQYANLSGELYEYMYRQSDELSPEVAFFYRLDPYGEESFDCDQAKYISELCGRLLMSLAMPTPPESDEISDTAETHEQDEDDDSDLSALPPFLLRLRKLCDAACESRSHIIMLGD